MPFFPSPTDPALFRASCRRCSHKICMADDPLIGLEGWCHKCGLCLRCQDILCETSRADVPTPGSSSEDPGSSIIRKTAQVVFMHEEVHPSNQGGAYDRGHPSHDAALGDEDSDHEILQGQTSRRSVVDNTLNLPKLPRLKVTRESTQQFFPAIKPHTRRRSLPAPSSLDSVKSFEEFLLNGKW